jgi:hypothetical protein
MTPPRSTTGNSQLPTTRSSTEHAPTRPVGTTYGLGRGPLYVPGSGLACRQRGEVCAHQLGAWLPHVKPCAYGPNRRHATRRHVVLTFIRLVCTRLAAGEREGVAGMGGSPLVVVLRAGHSGCRGGCSGPFFPGLGGRARYRATR